MVRSMGGVANTPGAARRRHLRPAHRHLRAARVRRHAGPQPGLPRRLPDRHGGVRARPHGGRRRRRHRHRALGRRADHQPGDPRQHRRADRRRGRARRRSTSGWRCSSPRCSSARRSCASRWPSPSASATELESLRAALTAPDLPAVDGIQIATSYTPADGPGGGRLLPRHPRRARAAPSWWWATSSATA